MLALALACGLSTTASAADEGPQGFVEKQHLRLSALLHEAPSATRDQRITHELDGLVDYDELARRTLGQPCPRSVRDCVNYFGQLSDARKTEVTSLLKQLVEKNYRKNLEKTLDYDVTYKGAKDLEGDTKIRTEAKSKSKPRDPAVQVDYVVRGDAGAYHVVDIVTEGSSLTKNYYDQFDKKFKAHPGDFDAGYAEIVKKLREKIAKP
jgi:ABC-type transporter MlaC component